MSIYSHTKQQGLRMLTLQNCKNKNCTCKPSDHDEKLSKGSNKTHSEKTHKNQSPLFQSQKSQKQARKHEKKTAREHEHAKTMRLWQTELC